MTPLHDGNKILYTKKNKNKVEFFQAILNDEDTFEMGRAKENMHEARRIMLQDMTGARLEKACLRHVNCPPRAEGIQVALVLNAVNPFYLWWSCMVRTGR